MKIIDDKKFIITGIKILGGNKTYIVQNVENKSDVRRISEKGWKEYPDAT